MIPSNPSNSNGTSQSVSNETSQPVPYTYELEKGWLFHRLKVLKSAGNVVHSFSLPWIKFYNPFIKVSKDEGN
ncbi:MAG: hypothetical protein JSS09_05900, partial [Verrucomicrobia bacterium]|nr:hypothetical protein [Verrucomicrobiota bacterium]